VSPQIRTATSKWGLCYRMTRKLATLTVVMPNYNHAHFLPQSLEAILSQSFPPSEVIVIDDASTDNSIEVIQHYAKKHPAIRLVCNERNMGPAFTYSRGLKLAKCDYIYSASADDTVLPGFFEKCVRLLERYPQAGLCSSISVVVDGEKRYEVPSPPYVTKVPSYLKPKEVLNCYVNKDWFIMGNTTIYRKSALNEKTFPDGIGRFNDEFTILMISLYYGACFVPESLSVYNIRSNSYSANSELELLSQRRKAETLMATTHSEYFPSDFVKYFAKSNTYLEATYTLKNIDKATNEYLETINSFLRLHKVSTLLVPVIIKKLVFAHKIIIKSILYFRLGRFSLFRVVRFLFY